MKKLSLGFAVVCLAVTGLASAVEDKAPMPQTRGMQGMDPAVHDPAAKPAMNCMPKPGSEKMDHAAKDHPMPDTRGMHGMDPAEHMQDCKNPNQTEPAEQGPHQHKTPGKS